MARILTQQQSLDRNFFIRTGTGFLLILLGFGIVLHTKTLGLQLLGFAMAIGGAWLGKQGLMFKIGARGEARVTKVLENFPDDWVVLNDIVVDGAQIDHILACPKGIFTIETKNYGGRVYGDANKSRWFYYLGKRKFSFYSPVKQALKHSLVLHNFLKTRCGLEKLWVQTLVVFARRDVKLKVHSPKVPVLHISELRDYLESLEDRLDEGTLEKAVRCLETLGEKQNRKA